ncbi:MAG TPA: zf-HC2 domain-containing protein [Planctomycetota bacterium]|nr:zf-HC2 domain-containing protein [Planctomycetota bacterium]
MDATPGKPVTCGEVRPDLVSFHEGALDPERERVVDGHLRGCSPCSEAHADLITLDHWVASESRPLPSDGFVERTVAAMVAAHGDVRPLAAPRPKEGRARLYLVPVLAAAAGVLVTVLALDAFDGSREDSQVPPRPSLRASMLRDRRVLEDPRGLYTGRWRAGMSAASFEFPFALSDSVPTTVHEDTL